MGLPCIAGGTDLRGNVQSETRFASWPTEMLEKLEVELILIDNYAQQCMHTFT